MEEDLKVDYLSISDIYKLQDLTGIQIMIGGYVDEKQLSEAIRFMIWRD